MMQVPQRNGHTAPADMPDDSSTWLAARALACIKNDTRLFTGLDISLGPAEVLQVDGANGSGKTSLIRILCGLAQADEGQVSWCGRDIHHYRFEFLSELSYVGHANGIKMDLSPVENMETARRLCGKPNTRPLEDVLDLVNLVDCAELPTARLSSGQKRRLALSRLLLADVRLWVLDEPFNSLDERSKDLVTGMIRQHVREGGSVVLTTHEAIDWQDLNQQVVTL